MRSTLIVAATALLVVALAQFLGDGALARAVRLGPSAGRGHEDSLPLPRPAPSGGFPVEAPPVPPTGPDLSLLSTHLEARGRVGEALKAVLLKTVGQDFRNLDRSFSRDYSAILQEWRADPGRMEEDLALLLRIFEEVRDPAFRWALSWLLQAVPDDRLIGPAVELLGIDPWRMVDTLAGIGTEAALMRLAAISSVIERPEVRAQALVQLARNGFAGVVRAVEAVLEDPGATDLERMNAASCLALMPDRPEALDLAERLALGPARLLPGAREWQEGHPVADLRAAAVLAVMRVGDIDALRRLLDHADGGRADPDFVRIVDAHIAHFEGSDVSRLVLDRIARRRRVSRGEALYLARTTGPADSARLRDLLPLAENQEARTALETAILNSQGR
jgi:hypothetical protein